MEKMCTSIFFYPPLLFKILLTQSYFKRISIKFTLIYLLLSQTVNRPFKIKYLSLNDITSLSTSLPKSHKQKTFSV